MRNRAFNRPIMRNLLLLILLFAGCTATVAQHTVHGTVVDGDGAGVPFASLMRANGEGTTTDVAGVFRLDVGAESEAVTVSALGFATRRLSPPADGKPLTIELDALTTSLDEVVVTGTMKPVSRARSPVPVEVFTAEYFRANPTPSVFEGLQTINGVRPQLNCAVCNTGDVHINGLEGPYTMVLIDGMPIVSGLSTVYGLTGIPQSMIARTEVVKGPAGTLYGSEAVGGLINVITHDPAAAPALAADVMLSGWGELNTDLGFSAGVGAAAHTLVGVNYFRYQNPIDDNGDGFTDLTLQDRVSVFNKWSFARPGDRTFSLAGRYVYEDRFGGQLGWRRADHRGGDEVYGESIFTNRWETFGTYQLPTPARIFLQFSANGHYQNSAYGDTEYDATQYVGFLQLSWRKAVGERHELLAGASYRYTWYDDDTPVTAGFGDGAAVNQPNRTHLPGVFVQDEVTFDRRNVLLLGLRYDHNSRHGHILTPRLNYQHSSADLTTTLRLGVGSGYRVANVFTEDHAALTGARRLVFAEALRPETSWNANANLTHKWFTPGGTVVGLDASTWYTYFTNRILPDYETDPNAIIYANLTGAAVSRGVSLNADASLPRGASLNAGVTLQDVFVRTGTVRDRQLLTETFSGVWRASVPVGRYHLTLDYTGNVYGPMDLPLLGELDDRPARSPWFSTQNLQVTKTLGNGTQLYGGVKNLLDYTPPANSIARAFDPFDRDVAFAPDGSVLATPANPRALTFDPTYVYASNQGRRWFVGCRVGW